MAKLTDEQGFEWEGEHKETELQPIHNKGEGKPIILRTFDFALPPSAIILSNQELLEANRKAINELLWKDELVPILEYKVVKSKDNHHFRIFATCQTRSGSIILEKPKLIQDLLHEGHV